MNQQIKNEILCLPESVKKEVLEANRNPNKEVARLTLIGIANRNKLWSYHVEMSRLIHEEDKANRAKIVKPEVEYKLNTLFE